jgi:hypothetical protein
LYCALEIYKHPDRSRWMRTGEGWEMIVQAFEIEKLEQRKRKQLR